MNRINNCRDETSLGTILRCFNSPINEEQAWALCYQIVKYVVNQISMTVDETTNNDSSRQLNPIKTLDDVILLQDGSVHVPSVFSGTIYSPNLNNTTLNVDTKCDKNTCKCIQSHVLHKKFIVSLGLILFQALDFGLSEDEERTLEPSLEILIERLTSADSEVSAVTSTTTSTHRGKCCSSKRHASNKKTVQSVNINDDKSKRIESSDGESDTEVPNELNDADDTDNDVTSCDEGIEEDSGGSSQPSSLKPENVSQSNNVVHKVNHDEENVTLSSSSSKNIGIKQINLSSSLPDSTNLSDSKVCSNLYTMTSASGLNLNVILQMCKCHLVIPSADTSQYTSSSIADDYSSPDTHYKAVCRALFIEANELNAFLRQIALGSAALAKSENNASPTTYTRHCDFVMTNAPSSSKTDSCISFDSSELSLVELNNLAQADWARMWMQVIRDLRAGVKLKTVSADDNENRCTEYELTPYEMLLEDIRARRYKLKHVNVEDTNVNSNKLKKDAHELILEFIRSRPPLVPVSRRNLPPLPPRQQTIYEKLMASIRSQPVKLRPVPMPRTSRQGSLRLGRVCQSTSKKDETGEFELSSFTFSLNSICLCAR